MHVNSMDNIPVNWNALDALVLDYAEVEKLLIESDIKATSNIDIRRTISHIHRLIQEGWVTEALDLIQQQAPSVLKDQRLLFRLHKQKFIELLRNGSADSRGQAIQCSRTVLGPCALNAYPEAYEEFKRLLLALIYNEDDESSPIAEEWSEARRADLAATVASILKAQLHAYDPLFSLALRYLISTHNRYCFRQGVASPISHIADTILDKERDPPAMPYDCLLEAPNFVESDVQALAQAVDLSRQGAVDSLRYTEGDLITAFKNELSRMKVDTGILDELVREYCVYRGLIDCVTSSSASTDSQSTINATETSDATNSSTRDVVMDSAKEDAVVEKPKLATVTTACPGKAHISEPKWDFDNNHKACAQEVTMQDGIDTFLEHREPVQAAGAESCAVSVSFCSKSEPIQSGGSNFFEQKHKAARQRSTVPRKRWKGRPFLSQSENKKIVCLDNGYIASSLSGQSGENHEIKIFIEEHKHLEIDKFGIALEIRELACEGLTDEVVEEVKRLNPQFFEHNPHLLFQLKQAEFLKLVDMGNYTEALGVARSDMGPLAAKYRDLLKPLKETVLALARPQGEAPVKPASPSMLAAALQVALGASLGITEPLLMKILRETLHTHTEWFKLQMCFDPFAEILNINALKEMESISVGSSSQDTHLETNVAVSSQLTASTTSTRASDGNLTQQSDSSRDGAMFDDGAILTVMEWMAVPRGDAIQLLAQYDGNVDNVFEHLLP